MPSENASLAVLKKELQKQGETLSAVMEKADAHYKGCNARQTAIIRRFNTGTKTMKALGQTLEEQNQALSRIEGRFESFDKWTKFFAKWGRWILVTMGGALISAWISVVVTAFYQHDQGDKIDRVTKAATAAAENTNTVKQKLDQLAPAQ